MYNGKLTRNKNTRNNFIEDSYWQHRKNHLNTVTLITGSLIAFVMVAGIVYMVIMAK